MSRRIFLFREQYGYTQREKIDRLPSSALLSDTAREFIGDEVDSEIELGDLGKEDFFRRLEKEFGEDTHEKFVEKLFNEHGKKGDTFNFRLFKIECSLSHQDLYLGLQDTLNSRLDDVFPDIFGNQALTITDVSKDDEEKIINFATKTAIKNRDIEPDEDVPIQIISAEDGSVEREYGPEYFVRAPSSDRIEVRTYTNSGIVGVSNRSGITKSFQESLAKLVAVLGGESDQDDK